MRGIERTQPHLHIAAGRPLRFTQAEIEPRGVAIECRVNAEDPNRDFAPTAGSLTEFVPPGGPFVRVDTHARTGWSVPVEYDSLLAKVVAWAPDRALAIERMRRALDEFRIAGSGVRTTARYLSELLDDSSFRAGTHTTRFLEHRARAHRDEERGHESTATVGRS